MTVSQIPEAVRRPRPATRTGAIRSGNLPRTSMTARVTSC